MQPGLVPGLPGPKAEAERRLAATTRRAERQLNGALVRLLDRVLPDDHGCWLWCGARSGDRLSQVMIGGRRLAVHHALYILLVGPLPDGWCHVRRRCRNPRCVRPDHLYIPDRKETHA